MVSTSKTNYSAWHVIGIGCALLSTFAWPLEFLALLKASPTHCRILVHDEAWPDKQTWHQLNQTVNGNLLKNVPLGAPCHLPNYDEERCHSLKESWVWPQEYLSSPSAIMSPYFQNASCDPWTSPETPCTPGIDPEYAISVSSADDVIAGIKFARDHNLRLVIKNTGHDYMGRSAGKGALSLWMHNLRSVEILEYQESFYSGKAARVAAGTLALEVYEAADAHNLRVAGGFCPTVGFAGGYTQGGGHGPLSSTYGLAADQVLEWEVVIANGSLITASPTQNTDLYWALSGGGPGTFGVVISVTVRAHEDGPVGGASIIVPAEGHTRDAYWAAFEAWQSVVPSLVDIGATAGYAVMRDIFFVQPITAPGISSATIEYLLQPFISKMKSLSITYTLQLTDSSSFIQHYTTYSGPLPQGLFTINHLFAGTILQRTAITKTNTELASTITIRNITDTTNAFLGFVALDVSPKGPRTPIAPNSVLPAWENALLTILAQYSWNYSAPLSTNIAGANLLTDFVVPKLRKFETERGTYMNEGDFQLRSWKRDFFGGNYGRLLGVKRRFDPEGLFYAFKTVGSNKWEVGEEERLCRVGVGKRVWGWLEDVYGFYFY